MVGKAAARGGPRQRLFLVAMFGLFMLPIVGAMVLNVMAPAWSPFGRMNRGELVTPPVRIESALLSRTDRLDTARTEAPGTWLIVHVSEPPCDATCERALVSLRQARLALGKDASRVERWWLMTRQAEPRTVGRVSAMFPGLRMAVLEQPWPVDRLESPLQVIDPAGYVFLRYRRPDAASDLLKDLKRLLKISTQG